MIRKIKNYILSSFYIAIDYLLEWRRDSYERMRTYLTLMNRITNLQMQSIMDQGQPDAIADDITKSLWLLYIRERDRIHWLHWRLKKIK